jgi:hypothetical protein
MKIRRWIAWKMVCVAARIHDAEYYERLTVKTHDGLLIAEWGVVGDEYGSGVSSQNVPLNSDYVVEWEEERPDWWDE